MEGYKPISMSQAAYDQLMANFDEAKMQAAAQQQNQQPRGCTLVVVVRLPGPTIDRSCGGGCGFIGGLFGRSCRMVGSTTSDALEISCNCGGGWLDGIFR